MVFFNTILLSKYVSRWYYPTIMSRSIRLIQLMQLLRSQSPPIKAADLARDTGISLRSVYRDIDSLRASGAIIDGEAGFGYTLVEDPALPPMMFSQDEMEALTLGLREVRAVADPVLAAAANSALSKIQASLPARMRQEFAHVGLFSKRFHERPDITIDMGVLRLAIRMETAVDITYSDAQSRISTRIIWPLGVIYMDNALALIAQCQTRNDHRVFRIDRITKMDPTNISFRPQRAPLLRAFFEKMRQEKR